MSGWSESVMSIIRDVWCFEAVDDRGNCRVIMIVIINLEATLNLSAELSMARILSSAIVTLGGQRVLFESVSRLGYSSPFCHFFGFLKVLRLSGLPAFRSYGLQSSSDSHVSPLLLAAITDMLHPFSDRHFLRCGWSVDAYIR